jgi:threonine aldolase
MQLASKMRFISAQFDAILTNNLWIENAKHSNQMATYLAEEAGKIPGVEITVKVEANEIFAILPREHIEKLQEEYFFYVWEEETSVVRWVTSFDTTKEDIDNFIAIMKNTLTK